MVFSGWMESGYAIRQAQGLLAQGFASHAPSRNGMALSINAASPGFVIRS